MSHSKKHLITDNLDQIRKWIEDGLYEKQIYNNLGMGKTSWEKYKKEVPELLEALKEGIKVPNTEVSNAMYKLSTGYNYIEQVSQKCKKIYYDEQGRKCEEEELKVVEIVKHQPPKTDAAKFWLINKMGEDFSLNPHEIERKKKEHKERMEIQKFNSF